MAIEMKLQKQNVSVIHQKPKSESDRSDDLVAVIKLDIVAEVNPDMLGQVCYGINTGFKDFLYDKEGQLRSEQLAKMNFDAEFKNHRIILAHNELKSVDLKDVVLRGFSAVPQTDGNVALSFQAKCKPTMDDMHYLTDGLISNDWTLEILGAVQGDMLDGVEPNEDDDPIAA